VISSPAVVPISGDAYRRVTDALEARGSRHRGGAWQCPAHDDRFPSLSVKQGDDRVLVHCHAGCSTEAICAALGLTLADLFDAPPEKPPQRRVAETYSYVGKDGAELFEVVRYEPKGFSQRRRNGSGYVHSLGDVERVLYRLPQVLAAIADNQPVYVVEGEKDVHALERAGATATCNPGGAGKWRPEYTDTLRGAHVAIIADQDKPGREHALTVARSLEGIAKTVQLFTPAAGKDAAEHLDKHSIAELVPVESDEITEAEAEADDDDYFVSVDLTKIKVRSITWIEKPFLATGELHILQGHGGVGKGALTIMWAAEASRRKERVVLISAEDDLSSQVIPRLLAAKADLRYIRPIERKDDGGALSIPGDVEQLKRYIVKHKIKLLVVDPLLSHVDGKVDSYKDHDVKRILTPLARIAQETGCAIVCVIHFRKDTSAGARLSGHGSTAFLTTARVTLSMAKAEDGTHVLEVSKSNIGPEGEGQAFTLEVAKIRAEEGDYAEVPLLKRAGQAVQTVDEILSKPRRSSKSSAARELILDILDDEVEVESDTLDSRIANETGLSAGSIRNLRTELKDAGLIKYRAESNADGTKKRFYVQRTNAPRPS
jgi:hypothetical protein